MIAWLDRYPWWQRATRRERVMLVAAALVTGIAIAWLGVWEPVNRELTRMEADMARERALLARARSQTEEIATITVAPPRQAADLKSGVEAALAQRGLAATSVELREARVRVVLAAARFDALIAALGALQRDAGVRVVEATLATRVEPGTVRAELTLVR